MIAGLGTDIVEIEAFASQLETPGTTFASSFTGAELRAARRKAEVSGSQAPHLAARWAAKEAFIKAWSAALFGQAPPLDSVPMNSIEVISDQWGRPGLVFHELPQITESLAERYGNVEAHWHLSLSHDGPWALATVICELRAS